MLMYMDEKLLNQLNETDTFNPYSAFNKNYDKSGDYKEIQNVLSEVKKYDVFDFMARVSALNLVPENQNKSILFDVLIASLLTLKKIEYTSTIKMSSGKFRKIINQVDNMNLKMGMDPAENVFVENVMFYDNYLIFPGINYIPGYCLQMMINTLFLHKNDFDLKFLKTASKLIQLVLIVSDKAATELGYKLEDIRKLEERNIVIPDSKKLEHTAELVTFDNNYIRYLVEDDTILEEFYSDFGQGDVATALNVEQQKFFVKPFIKAEEDKTLILNISVLSSFIFHKIICLGDKFGYKKELINTYNVSVWRDCHRSLNVLGHKKIKEKDWGISLLERNDYKDILLNVCNNQVMIVTYICDDGKDYSEETIFSMHLANNFSKLIEKRISYFHEKLSQQNIKYEDIFHIIIVNSFGRGIRVSMNKQRYYIPLALSPHDLRCIAINEKSDAVFLPRYIRAKSKLHSSAPNLFSELNSIEIYVNNQYSFFLNDDFNPKNNMLYIAPGDSIDYIIRSIHKEKRHLVESYKDDYFLEVVLNDEARNIYTDLVSDVPRASLLAKFNNVSIWIYSPQIVEFEGLNLYFSIVDAISYWLEECKDIIERYNFAFNVIKFQIKLAGNLQEYYYNAYSAE